MLESVAKLVNDATKGNRAGAILEELRGALAADEINQAFVPKVADLVRRAGELLRDPILIPEPPAGWKPVLSETTHLAPGDHQAVVETIAEKISKSVEDRAGEYRVSVVVEKRNGR